jgi:hypothetical protein
MDKNWPCPKYIHNPPAKSIQSAAFSRPTSKSQDRMATDSELPDPIRKGLTVFSPLILSEVGDIGLYHFLVYYYVFTVIVPFL